MHTKSDQKCDKRLVYACLYKGSCAAPNISNPLRKMSRVMPTLVAPPLLCHFCLAKTHSTRSSKATIEMANAHGLCFGSGNRQSNMVGKSPATAPVAFWCRQAPGVARHSRVWRGNIFNCREHRKVNRSMTISLQRSHPTHCWKRTPLACLRLPYTEYSHDGHDTYKYLMVH